MKCTKNMKIFFETRQDFLSTGHIFKNKNVGAKHVEHSLVPIPSKFGAHTFFSGMSQNIFLFLVHFKNIHFILFLIWTVLSQF